MKTKTLVVLALFILILVSVQVQAATCLDEVQSKKTLDFMEEIPALNAKLDGVACNNKVPYFKNEVVTVKISMRDGSTQAFTVTTKKGVFTTIEKEEPNKKTHIVKMGECEFDTLLRAESKGGVFAYIYLEKKIEITAKGFFKKITLAVKKIGLGIVLKKVQTPVDIICT